MSSFTDDDVFIPIEQVYTELTTLFRALSEYRYMAESIALLDKELLEKINIRALETTNPSEEDGGVEYKNYLIENATESVVRGFAYYYEENIWNLMCKKVYIERGFNKQHPPFENSRLILPKFSADMVESKILEPLKQELEKFTKHRYRTRRYILARNDHQSINTLPIRLLEEYLIEYEHTHKILNPPNTVTSSQMAMKLLFNNNNTLVNELQQYTNTILPTYQMLTEVLYKGDDNNNNNNSILWDLYGYNDRTFPIIEKNIYSMYPKDRLFVTNIIAQGVSADDKDDDIYPPMFLQYILWDNIEEKEQQHWALILAVSHLPTINQTLMPDHQIKLYNVEIDSINYYLLCTLYSLYTADDILKYRNRLADQLQQSMNVDVAAAADDDDDIGGACMLSATTTKPPRIVQSLPIKYTTIELDIVVLVKHSLYEHLPANIKNTTRLKFIPSPITTPSYFVHFNNLYGSIFTEHDMFDAGAIQKGKLEIQGKGITININQHEDLIGSLYVINIKSFDWYTKVRTTFFAESWFTTLYIKDKLSINKDFKNTFIL